ncbi:D-inositol-3-phosphate glycosyltransferase [Paraburkholderia ultramafica]|uniref:D-inositol-3-phosphate glycosyltransferase n=1 Tax=Paraburkholderia ultramafica TaxID=1544867 RepID=A0A6S7B684_9BURK|nr:glycosyltransferase family 1 protein [Paraburkholderia ultramafica]CAB3789267.1 D-inositol-3-phosphate glycosyltransferase [Paraburkholderia ultramafica]
MKLILSVDALVPPLTGIGRYTWELARYYQSRDGRVDSVRFFRVNEWVADPANMLRIPALRKKQGYFRRQIPKWWRAWALRRQMADAVFHAPNYFLPECVDSGIVTVHDLSVFKYPETHPVQRRRHFEVAFGSTLARANHIITDSEAIRLEVAEFFGWSMDKITAIPLGVSGKFRQRSESELAGSLRDHGLVYGNYSLCVSTLEPRKRVDQLVRAYSRLPATLRQRFPLVLVGSRGWLSDDLHTDLERGEREGWLRYLGFVPEAQLPFLYAGARAFFFPSTYEGFGLPVLEAMASGVPTLTSNSSSLPEVAGDAAWLVRSDDTDALMDGIKSVLLDESWRTAAVARGLRVAGRRSWEACARQTFELCRSFA